MRNTGCIYVNFLIDIDHLCNFVKYNDDHFYNLWNIDYLYMFAVRQSPKLYFYEI